MLSEFKNYNRLELFVIAFSNADLATYKSQDKKSVILKFSRQ